MSKNSIDQVVVLGSGEVVHDRVLPSVRELKLELPIDRCALVDIKPREMVAKTIGGFQSGEYYFQNSDGKLPLRELENDGYLTSSTLVINCTPTCFHVPFAREIAPHVGLVAIERPLSNCSKEASSLFDLEDKAYPMGHQLHMPEILALIHRSMCGDIPWTQIEAMFFGLQETKGVGTRQLDDAIFDLVWHGIEVIFAAIRAARFSASIIINDTVKVATYKDGPDAPKRFTAASVDGHIETDTFRVPFAIRCGKGLGSPLKLVIGCIGSDRIQLATLHDTSSFAAHQRMIGELLTSNRPNMQLSLRDAVAVVEACELASKFAVTMPEYEFGTTPTWLEFPSFNG